MFSASEKDRYSRHFILEGFGEAAQEKLKQARVVVVGAGGLGCPALLYLSAAGVGNIAIIDGDKVGLSNLQRQVLYGVDDIGINKAEAARKRLLQLNPEITITAIQQFISVDNALELLKTADVVIDGSDNFATRYLISDACVMLKKPLVYGAIFKFTGQLSVFNFNGGPTYRCLFPEAPEAGEVPGCGEVGVLGVLPGIIGSYQALEAIKVITGVGEVLTGKVMAVDLLENVTSYFNFHVVPENLNIKQLEAIEYSCTTIQEISWNDFKQLKGDFRLIDVREPGEYQAKNIGGENIPLQEFLRSTDQFNSDDKLIIHCQSGMRATRAIEALGTRSGTYLLKEIPWSTI